MIKLNDILKIENLENVKIRLNLSNSSWNAIEHYHNNPTKMLIGNFHNSRDKIDENGKVKRGRIWFKENDIVIGLAQIKYDDWLLIDISKITKNYNKTWDGESQVELNTFYEYEKIEEYEKYFGRLIVHFHKYQAFVTLTGKNIDYFTVKEIMSSYLDKDIFPGYENVNISWVDLQRVIEKDTWETALKYQKGVYLLSDISNGKKYVGAAYGGDMILGRWKDYLKTGHGGNEGLKKCTFEHIKENFRFSILDIFKSTTDDEIIKIRERWWKDVLQSIKFGYNENK